MTAAIIVGAHPQHLGGVDVCDAYRMTDGVAHQCCAPVPLHSFHGAHGCGTASGANAWRAGSQRAAALLERAACVWEAQAAAVHAGGLYARARAGRGEGTQQQLSSGGWWRQGCQRCQGQAQENGSDGGGGSAATAAAAGCRSC